MDGLVVRLVFFHDDSRVFVIGTVLWRDMKMTEGRRPKTSQRAVRRA